MDLRKFQNCIPRCHHKYYFTFIYTRFDHLFLFKYAHCHITHIPQQSCTLLKLLSFWESKICSSFSLSNFSYNLITDERFRDCQRVEQTTFLVQCIEIKTWQEHTCKMGGKYELNESKGKYNAKSCLALWENIRITYTSSEV